MKIYVFKIGKDGFLYPKMNGIEIAQDKRGYYEDFLRTTEKDFNILYEL